MTKTLSKDYDLKRSVILLGATKTFAEIGFDRASMNQVASECGVSKAALYHYFPSKNSLLYSILDDHLSRLRDRVLALKKKDADDIQYLRDIIEEILIFYRGNDHVHDLQIHALGQLEASDQDTLKAYMRSLVDHISKAIKAINPKSFEDPKKLRMATMSLFGMLNWYYTWNSGHGVETRRTYARYVADIMIKGAY